MILAPGRSLSTYKGEIQKTAKDSIVIAANFTADEFVPSYVFSSNMRRFVKIQGHTDAKCIVTSNMKECTQKDYVVNFSSYTSKNPDIIDNSVLMLLKLLMAANVREAAIAGMDGYSVEEVSYYDNELNFDFSKEAKNRNTLISAELADISKHMQLNFITPTVYEVN